MKMSRHTTGILGAFDPDPTVLFALQKKAAALLDLLSLEVTLVTGDSYFIFLDTTSDTIHSEFPFKNFDTIAVGFTVPSPSSQDSEILGHYLLCDISDPQGCTFRTDPIGSINLYRWVNQHTVIFGTSSIQVASLLPDCKIDETGAYEFLTAGYLFSNRSFYQNVDILKGGMTWTVHSDTPLSQNEVCWWHPPSTGTLSEPDALLQLRNHSTTSAKLISLAGHACCDLTGGYDSRGILAMFLDSDVSFSTTVAGEKNSPDVCIASRIANVFSLDHTHNDSSSFLMPNTLDDIRPVLYLTDGEIDFIEYYFTSIIQQKTAQKNWMTINGSGGEFFRGYWWEGEWPLEGIRKKVNREYLLKRLLQPGLDFSLFKINESDWKSYCHSIISDVLQEAGTDALNVRKIDFLYFRLRMGRWFARYYSSTMKILPCYSPFLLEPMLNIAFSISAKKKKRVRFYRKWLANYNAKLAKIPLENGSPAIPLTLSSAWRFWPFALHIVKKIWQRIKQKISPQTKEQQSSLKHSYLKIALKKKGGQCFFDHSSMVKTLLSDETWKQLSTCPPEQIEQLIPSGQLTRLITLELTLREAQKLRKKLDTTSKQEMP